MIYRISNLQTWAILFVPKLPAFDWRRGKRMSHALYRLSCAFWTFSTPFWRTHISMWVLHDLAQGMAQKYPCVNIEELGLLREVEWELPLSFSLLSLDTALGHVWSWWQVWVWHISYLKNQKKITIQIFDKATSVKTIYKQSSGTGIPRHVPAQPYDFLCWNLTLAPKETKVAAYKALVHPQLEYAAPIWNQGPEECCWLGL